MTQLKETVDGKRGKKRMVMDDQVVHTRELWEGEESNRNEV